eukprot:COSAG01_NODE_11907_length_1837_cov_1.586881_2_plen_118_part_01
MEWTRRAASPATSSASSKTHLAALGEPLASPWPVFSVSRRAFPSWNRSILNEIYLCHACSYQGILRTETPESGLFWLFVPNVLDFRMPAGMPTLPHRYTVGAQQRKDSSALWAFRYTE